MKYRTEIDGLRFVAVVPVVFSIAEDALTSVPRSYVQAALAVGSTRWQAAWSIVLPAALPGVFAAVVLGFGRAIGETMIVVMAASFAANLSANPFDAMTTVTVQIVALLTGEGSFDHPATLAAFALGFVLFVVTLGLNFIALRVVKRFREAYE